MRIIPAIDIIDGKCVRLTKGNFASRKIYHANPVEQARIFEDNGIKFLHLVDLDGARAHRIVNRKVLEQIARNTNLIIDFGGGVQSDHDIKTTFESGATRVTAGSLAAKNKEKFLQWINTYGNERIILGADAINEKIAVSGWQETTSFSIHGYIKDFVGEGVRYVISTDISRDGMLKGPAFGLYQRILTENPGICLIASGGISGIHDLHRLKSMGLHGAIIGKALYEGSIQLNQLRELC